MKSDVDALLNLIILLNGKLALRSCTIYKITNFNDIMIQYFNFCIDSKYICFKQTNLIN